VDGHRHSVVLSTGRASFQMRIFVLKIQWRNTLTFAASFRYKEVRFSCVDLEHGLYCTHTGVRNYPNVT
jgi:hypothetical protein